MSNQVVTAGFMMVAQNLGKLVDDEERFICEGFKNMIIFEGDRTRLVQLMAKWIRIKSLSDAPLFNYIEREVWPYHAMTIFFMERPFEQVVLQQHGKPITPEYLKFIATALNRGADTDRLATALVPSFATSLASEVRALDVPIVNILLTFSKTCEPDLLQDRKLLDSLAQHLTAKTGIVHPVVEICLTILDTMITVDLKEIVYKLHYIATSSAVSHHLDQQEALIVFKLFSNISKTDVWHEYTANMAITFVKKKLKPDECILLIYSLLESSSVLFLVLLSKLDLLGLLRETLDFVCLCGNGTHGHKSYEGITWVDVYNILNQKWPDLSSDTGASQDADEETCPITLCPFVKPVVASDGHTYERTAIMRHMADNGMVSPMTKEPMTYILYDNWSAVRTKKQRLVN
ncbi:MAG: hypothetical protein CBC65_000075 [Rhodothermaceae bacterium TMED105]|nr:MAG: hypothetical protein CBC65_000230 [Rhodothermaceae bacterium TMED105]RPF82664.1 MAG: hypothetical protein CBC65_000075 [Rhodothermaceae bacterium TMED105]|tara:strand:+ start:11883 stop:13094 length:1212 start_codon:yes stop_codon:yes gene_type:complete